MLAPGDPAPWFTASSSVNPLFRFHSAAGRYVALCFLSSAANRRIVDDAFLNHERFDGRNACSLGVSTDPDDQRVNRMDRRYPGIIFFRDFDRAISRLYGASPREGRAELPRPHTLILDPSLRTLTAITIDGDGSDHLPRILAILDGLPPIETIAGFAPVIVVSRVFELEFCQMLIDLYDRPGGQDSGFMRDVDGKTVAVMDHSFRRRTDHFIQDEAVSRSAQFRIRRRLVPEIYKAFQFHVTRIERHLVACYDSKTGDWFHPHRDNTTKGTAHRRFAVTINLNAEEYEGGHLRFPEYGPRTYQAPTGGAVVFSCSLLHEATAVTRGRRLVYLPFLYDEEAAKVRAANARFVANQDNTAADRGGSVR